jgi:aspartate dehydrogenase
MKKRVGLVGYGIIGKYIFEKLSGDDVEFVFIYDKKKSDDREIAGIFTDSAAGIGRMCENGLDLVIETATQEAVVELAPLVLKSCDMIIFSTTALADEEFQDRVEKLCSEHKHRMFVPHGAILGLDGLQDGRDVLREVSITTIKKPRNLGRTDKERTVIYEGPTREICKMYPRNVNVHAGLALAGLGFDKTRSTLVSDPGSPGNMHVIEIIAEGCRFKIEVLSEPLSGVTGAYTPVSACASVRRVLFSKGIVIV